MKDNSRPNKSYTFGVNNDRVGADCGNCEARHHCPMFVLDILPKVTFVVDAAGSISRALEATTRVRDLDDDPDRQHDYIVGGAVSYLKSLNEGTNNLEIDQRECTDTATAMVTEFLLGIISDDEDDEDFLL